MPTRHKVRQLQPIAPWTAGERPKPTHEPAPGPEYADEHGYFILSRDVPEEFRPFNAILEFYLDRGKTAAFYLAEI